MVIQFTVAVAPGVPAGTYQNAAEVRFLDPARTAAAGTTARGYDPASSTGDDATVLPLTATATATSSATATDTPTGTPSPTETATQARIAGVSASQPGQLRFAMPHLGEPATVIADRS